MSIVLLLINLSLHRSVLLMTFRQRKQLGIVDWSRNQYVVPNLGQSSFSLGCFPDVGVKKTDCSSLGAKWEQGSKMKRNNTRGGAYPDGFWLPGTTRPKAHSPYIFPTIFILGKVFLVSILLYVTKVFFHVLFFCCIALLPTSLESSFLATQETWHSRGLEVWVTVCVACISVLGALQCSFLICQKFTVDLMYPIWNSFLFKLLWYLESKF